MSEAVCWSCGAETEGFETCRWCGVLQSPFDTTVPPPEVRRFVDLAMRWGISDDGYRGDAVDAANAAALTELVTALDGSNANVLYDWLASEAKSAVALSPEYVVMTCMTMAADSARLRLARIGGQSPG